MHIFDEYLNDKDLGKRERAKLWRVSIGLQAVDNLRVSNFLIETARKHIEGLISMDEVTQMIDEHYEQKRKQSRQNIKITYHIALQLFKMSNKYKASMHQT